MIRRLMSAVFGLVVLVSASDGKAAIVLEPAPGQFTVLFTSNADTAILPSPLDVGESVFNFGTAFAISGSLNNALQFTVSEGSTAEFSAEAGAASSDIPNLRYAIYEGVLGDAGPPDPAGYTEAPDLLSVANLSANATYVIRILGDAAGSAGSYDGQLNVVPLPGAFLLFVSALVGLGYVGRARGARQSI